MKNTLLTFILIFTPYFAFSQNMVNLDFEEIYSKTKIATQWKTSVDNGTYEVDDKNVSNGKYSLKITSPSANYPKLAYIEIGQLLNKHINKTIRIEVKAKWDNNQTITPDFTLEVNHHGKNTTLKSDIHNIHEGGDWKLLYLEFNLTHSQQKAYLSVRNNDKGVVWFDNVRILSNGKEISSKQEEIRLDLSKENIQLLTIKERNNYILPKSFIEELYQKRIIGIGEGTHGSLEFRFIQKSIIQRLLTQQMNLLIALEASASDCMRLNEYIIKGIGSPQDILKQMNTNHFKYYCTEDFLEFIEWLRDENQKRRVKVRLYGVDVQYNNNAGQLIQTNDNIKAQIDTINAICRRNRYLYPNDENKDELKQLEFNLTELLKNLSKKITTSFNDYYLAQTLYLQLLGQKNYLQERDSLMAENIHLLNRQFPESQLIFLAHNTHCSTNDNYGGIGLKMTGFFLRKKFGHQFVSIGTCSNEGSYTAQNFANESKVMDKNGFFTSTDFTSKNVTSDNILHFAPQGSIEHYMNKLNYKIALVKLQQTVPSKILMRDIGLVKRDCEQFTEVNTNIFDYLAYFGKVHSTRLISY